MQELVSGTPSVNFLTGLGIDEFFTRTDGSGTSAYLTDALGSTVALADGSAAVQTEYTYEPFGGTSVSGSSSANTLAFTGREVDGTGLYFYRARYYDPRLQRFVSEDPISFEGGDQNLYAFVANDPVNSVDPLGLSARGKRRLDVHLPTGEVLNKRTPIETIDQVVDEASKRGLSKETVKALKALQKVVRRGGAMALVMELLDPEPLISAECPAGPGTCPPYQRDPANPPLPPGSSPKGPRTGLPGDRGGLPGDLGGLPGTLAGRK